METTPADNARRISQFTAFKPFPEGSGPKILRGETITCKKTCGTITEGCTYIALEDSFMGVSFHEILEYVMVVNDEDTWGIYLIEFFYTQGEEHA